MSRSAASGGTLCEGDRIEHGREGGEGRSGSCRASWMTGEYKKISINQPLLCVLGEEGVGSMHLSGRGKTYGKKKSAWALRFLWVEGKTNVEGVMGGGSHRTNSPLITC